MKVNKLFRLRKEEEILGQSAGVFHTLQRNCGCLQILVVVWQTVILCYMHVGVHLLSTFDIDFSEIIAKYFVRQQRCNLVMCACVAETFK